MRKDEGLFFVDVVVVVLLLFLCVLLLLLLLFRFLLLFICLLLLFCGVAVFVLLFFHFFHVNDCVDASVTLCMARYALIKIVGHVKDINNSGALGLK